MKDKRILITGASGLLGKELVKQFEQLDFFVLAQYYTNRGVDSDNCRWIHGDLSSESSIKTFIDNYKLEIQPCSFLINNFGPITHKPINLLTGKDILNDFTKNVLPAFEIQNFLLKNSNLEFVLNILFEDAARIKPYKNIVSYAIAKNSMLILSESFAGQYPKIKFKNIFPGSLKGANVKKKGEETEPGDIAQMVVRMILEGKFEI